MAMRRMLFVAFLLPLSVTTLAQEQVTTADDQVKEGKSMREVQVKGHRKKEVTLPKSNALNKYIKDLKLQRKYSPSGLMGEKVNDYITHPFGFKERKVKKIRKRRQKIRLLHHSHYCLMSELHYMLIEHYYILSLNFY